MMTTEQFFSGCVSPLSIPVGTPDLEGTLDSRGDYSPAVSQSLTTVESQASQNGCFSSQQMATIDAIANLNELLLEQLDELHFEEFDEMTFAQAA